MKHMIDAEKFLDKLLYMGYMDEEKSEVEEVANNMTEDAYTKDDVIAILTELQSDVEECVEGAEGSAQFEQGTTNVRIQIVKMIQEKINALDNGDIQRGNTAVWIERKNTPRGCGEYLCSACMNEDGTDFLTTYCPDCGAYHGKNKKTVEENTVEMPNYSEIPTDSTTKNDLDTINSLDDFIEFGKKAFGVELTVKKSDNPDTYAKLFGATKNDLVREFEGIEVTYLPEEVCIYPEYKGKPYFAIKYKDNLDGEEIVGYGTYNPKVLSQYLKDYFIPPVTPLEPKCCKDCKWGKL